MATKKKDTDRFWHQLDASTSPGAHAFRAGKNKSATRRAAALELGGALGGGVAGSMAGAAIGARRGYPATGAFLGGTAGSMAGAAAGTNRAHKKGYYKKFGKSYTVSAFGVEHGY